ncbi:PREDICTED: facilitated trehalose transporter Tret1-like [Wasmannia auropunctata]|uniref:facilitated trehalose transporter Tret1-like n=1 Tax=Wasmannia auropunctata TaxID=64793 RepID=UPI0005EF4D43|nr:PREDICTED: facilitated trehalose transporter Tret1-like [Wasmannia auropunctata]
MNLQLKVQKDVLLLFLYTIVCNLVLISAGATVGYSSVVLPILTDNTSITDNTITLNTMESSLFVSILSIIITIGCFLSIIMMNYGRRRTMIVCGVIFSLGWILMATSYNVIQLFVGRILTGFGYGLCTTSVGIYLAEISIPSWREVITVTPNVALTIGILVVYLLGYVIENNWRLMAAVFSIPSILFVLCNIFFICESPEWLLLKGQKEKAKIALLRIRGLHQETIEFQEEFSKMVNYIELSISQNCQIDSSSTKEFGWRSFLNRNVWGMLTKIRRMIVLPEVWKPFVILNLYLLFQKFCGLYVIIYYTVDIITRLKITIDPFLITVIVGTIQVIGNMIAACFSKRIGRRIISIVSGTGISISLGALAIYLQFFETTGITVVPLVCFLLYVGFGAFGFFSMPLAMIPELYPSKYVNVLGQITNAISLLSSFVIVQLYPTMVTHDRNATIYFYCVIAIIATVFLTITLPETLGKTKTQIEEAFKDKLKINETFKKIEDAC